jgi:predicted MFS family arabinose efflux permease
VVYGLEATTQELIYITGPAAVGLIAGLAGARTAVVVSGAIGLVGALAYVSSPVFAGGHAARRDGRRTALGFAVGIYAAVAVCLTVGLAMTDIATVDFVGGRHPSASAGVVLAVWSVGSLVGGLLFGAAAGIVTDRRLAQAVALTGTGLALCAVAPGRIGLAALLALSGLAVAPTMARLYSRIGAAAGDGSPTEAFGWLAVGFLVGSAAGAAMGGLSVDALGARWTFVLAGTGTLCALPVIASGRRVASSRGR